MFNKLTGLNGARPDGASAGPPGLPGGRARPGYWGAKNFS